jgi:hypothetical protein
VKGSKENRIGKRENLEWDAISVRTLANPARNSEVGLVMCPQFGAKV